MRSIRASERARLAQAPSQWLTLTQASKVYPFSRRTLWRFIAAGRLAAFRPTPAKVLVRREDVDRLIAANQIDVLDKPGAV